MVEYIEQRGRFVYPEELVQAMIKSLGKSRGVVRLYVSSMLLQYKKRGLLIRIIPLNAWGLPVWGDPNMTARENYLPDAPACTEEIIPCGVLRKSRQQTSFTREPAAQPKDRRT